MKFSLIICTYMRPKPLLQLLQSVDKQSVYPNEILIIDGSLNNDTELVLKQNQFSNIKYFLVSNDDRGLTKQRNFGISKVSNDIEIVCFLDDDTVLESNYFEEIIKAYSLFPDALGIGGYIINEADCEYVGKIIYPKLMNIILIVGKEKMVADLF